MGSVADASMSPLSSDTTKVLPLRICTVTVTPLLRHGRGFRGWTWENSLDHQKHMHVARTPHVATQHRRHRVLLAMNQSLEERLLEYRLCSQRPTSGPTP